MVRETRRSLTHRRSRGDGDVRAGPVYVGHGRRGECVVRTLLSRAEGGRAAMGRPGVRLCHGGERGDLHGSGGDRPGRRGGLWTRRRRTCSPWATVNNLRKGAARRIEARVAAAPDERRAPSEGSTGWYVPSSCACVLLHTPTSRETSVMPRRFLTDERFERDDDVVRCARSEIAVATVVIVMKLK